MIGFEHDNDGTAMGESLGLGIRRVPATTSNRVPVSPQSNVAFPLWSSGSLAPLYDDRTELLKWVGTSSPSGQGRSRWPVSSLLKTEKSVTNSLLKEIQPSPIDESQCPGLPTSAIDQIFEESDRSFLLADLP